jgi:hypothetical protein
VIKFKDFVGHRLTNANTKYALEIFIEAEFLSEVRRRKTEEETRIS